MSEVLIRMLFPKTRTRQKEKEIFGTSPKAGKLLIWSAYKRYQIMSRHKSIMLITEERYLFSGYLIDSIKLHLGYLPMPSDTDRMWHKINFKWSKANLKSVFLLPDRLTWWGNWSGSPLCYLLISGVGETRKIHSLLKTQSKKCTTLSKIWTRLASSLLYISNRNAKHAKRSIMMSESGL